MVIKGICLNWPARDEDVKLVAHGSSYWLALMTLEMSFDTFDPSRHSSLSKDEDDAKWKFVVVCFCLDQTWTVTYQNTTNPLATKRSLTQQFNRPVLTPGIWTILSLKMFGNTCECFHQYSDAFGEFCEYLKCTHQRSSVYYFSLICFDSMVRLWRKSGIYLAINTRPFHAIKFCCDGHLRRMSPKRAQHCKIFIVIIDFWSYFRIAFRHVGGGHTRACVLTERPLTTLTHISWWVKSQNNNIV